MRVSCYRATSLEHMRNIATGRFPCTIFLLVSVSVCPVNCVKTANGVWMLCGRVSWVGSRICSVDGGGNRPMGRGNFWGGYGLVPCNQCRICGIAV